MISDAIYDQLEIIGITLAQQRAALGMTQREVAAKAGITQPSVHRAEMGKYLSLTMLLVIADVLDMKVEINPR